MKVWLKIERDLIGRDFLEKGLKRAFAAYLGKYEVLTKLAKNLQKRAPLSLECELLH